MLIGTKDKFDEMINNDLELMWSIQNFCHHSSYASRIEKIMDCIVSKVLLRIIFIAVICFLTVILAVSLERYRLGTLGCVSCMFGGVWQQAFLGCCDELCICRR